MRVRVPACPALGDSQKGLHSDGAANRSIDPPTHPAAQVHFSLQTTPYPPPPHTPHSPPTDTVGMAPKASFITVRKTVVPPSSGRADPPVRVPLSGCDLIYDGCVLIHTCIVWHVPGTQKATDRHTRTQTDDMAPLNPTVQHIPNTGSTSRPPSSFGSC